MCLENVLFDQTYVVIAAAVMAEGLISLGSRGDRRNGCKEANKAEVHSLACNHLEG